MFSKYCLLWVIKEKIYRNPYSGMKRKLGKWINEHEYGKGRYYNKYYDVDLDLVTSHKSSCVGESEAESHNDSALHDWFLAKIPISTCTSSLVLWTKKYIYFFISTAREKKAWCNNYNTLDQSISCFQNRNYKWNKTYPTFIKTCFKFSWTFLQLSFSIFNKLCSTSQDLLL